MNLGESPFLMRHLFQHLQSMLVDHVKKLQAFQHYTISRLRVQVTDRIAVFLTLLFQSQTKA